jgi:hypothetical protein
VAALAIQAAAEAEAVLAAAERSKAILPVCVGASTTASAFALLMPSLAADIGTRLSIEVYTQVFLLCPVIAVLAAAIGGLASQESRSLASKASGVGNRRFASSKSVGKSWLSVAEFVTLQSERTSEKWKGFAIAVASAPFAATLFPGSIAVKSIVCASIGINQTL